LHQALEIQFDVQGLGQYNTPAQCSGYRFLTFHCVNASRSHPVLQMFKDSANTIPQLSVQVIDFLHSTVSMLHGPSPCYRCLRTRPIQYPSSVFRLKISYIPLCQCFTVPPVLQMFKDSANTIPQLSVQVIDFLHSTVSMLHGPSPCYRCSRTWPIQYPSSVFRL